MSRTTLLGVLAVVTIAAASLRLVELDNRAMHTDEAVHAEKFRKLLEEGHYRYDPDEYHGPGLNYLTLPITGAAGVSKLVDVTEVHLRLLPALFGIGLVAGVWLIRRDLGPVATVCAAGLTAISPAMVFYSRYYIQEMLLVGFTFVAAAALWRALRSPGGPRQRERQVGWLVLAGLCLGMMHVAKETFVIAGFAATVATVTVWLWHRRGSPAPRPTAGLLLIAAAIVLVVAAGISALFHSSFFDNPQGVADSVFTYEHYVARAPGQGTGGDHTYPWHEYLRRLLWWHEDGGVVWSEMAIVALAVLGAAAAVTGKGLGTTCRTVARFLTVYTVVLTVAYAAIPYKTPWCMLGFLHGMILLAGIGAAAALRLAPCVYSKAMVAAVLAAAAGHLGYQAWRGSFPACEDPTNPYVYAQTTNDARLLADQIRAIAAAGPDGLATDVQVITSDSDVWPLPWYLRDMPRVGYPRAMPSTPEALAPIVIMQPQFIDALRHTVGNGPLVGQQRAYVPVPRPPDDEDYTWVPMLRPSVPLRAFVRPDLWQTYLDAVHPARDARLLAEMIRALAAAGDDGMATPVQVITSDGDARPLSAYLRDMSGVSYRMTVPSASEALAPIVIIPPHLKDALLYRISEVPPPGEKHTYIPLPRMLGDDDYDWGWHPMLRPKVPVCGFVKHDLWQQYTER